MRAANLTHMGIYVWDLPKMRDLYTHTLGLVVSDQGHAARLKADICFMSGNEGIHHQVVLVGGRPAEAKHSTVMQISFTVDSLAELRQVRDKALANGATDMRPISHGNAWSIYFADPEGNVVEVYLDSPWHVPQPHGDPLDLDKSDAQILAETEAVCRADPGFMPRAEWEKVQAARLAH